MSTKLSITRALATIVKLEEKIAKRTAVLNPVHIAAGIDSQLAIPGSLVSVDRFREEAIKDFQGITDLMKVRDELKEKVVQSNAVTIVKIGNDSMTVAQAIERKRSIALKESLLNRLKTTYSNAQLRLNKANNEFEAKLDASRATYFGRDKAPTAEQVAVVENPVRLTHTPSLVDPLDLAAKISALEEEIDDFKSNVDFTLSESNARTEIEVEGSL